MSCKLSSFLIAFTLSCISSFAQNMPLATIPFELRADNRIYIKCSVNGSDSLTFMFDTGAGPMVINKSILDNKLKMTFDGEVDNIGINGTVKSRISYYNKVSFGGIETDSVRFVEVNYGQSPFDGVFGIALMKKYVIEVDYNKRKMHFYDPATYKVEDADFKKLDVVFHSNVPLVTVGIIIGKKKHLVKYELDTGGDGGIIVTNFFATKNDLFKKLKTVAHANSVGSDGMENKSPIVILPEITFTDKNFYMIPATLYTSASGVFADQNISGIFGNNFLKRFNMIIDIPHNQVYIKPNNLLHTPYYDFLIK